MKLPKRLASSRGFTLIELMVVVSIIAILAVVGLTLFNNVQASARDAKRRGDVDAIATALEQRFEPSAVRHYPQIATSLFSNQLIPRDPSTRNPYIYDAAGVTEAIGANTFRVCAQLQTGGGNATASNGTIVTGDPFKFYCKHNTQ